MQDPGKGVNICPPETFNTMTTTPKSLVDECLHESWVELNLSSGEVTRSCNTPVPVPVTALPSNMEKLLLEAQRESSHASTQSSRIPSRGGSPPSPKSPASEVETPNDLFFVNKEELSTDRQPNMDWILEWSSRPDQQPPKEWKFVHPTKSRLSFRTSKIAKRGLFSTEVLSFVVLTNIISLILGAGIGLYIGKRFTSAISTFGKSLD